MKRFLKVIPCLLLALVMVIAAVGCSYKRPGDTTEEVKYTVNFDIPASTQTTIKVLIPDDEYERKIMNALIAGFNQKYPLIEVQINTLTIDRYNTVVFQQSQAGILADIIWTNSSNFYFLISNGISLNLNRFIEQGTQAGVFNYEADFTSDFKAMGTVGENRYAIPRSIDSIVCFYNKEILEKAGADMTLIQDGWTWDDFLTICESVRNFYDTTTDSDYNNREFYPVDANLTWESVAYPIIKSLGGEVLNENGEFALTKEKSDEIVAFVKKLVDKRYVAGENSSQSSFESGTGALYFQSTSIDKLYNKASLINKITKKPKFDVVSFPLINGENSVIGNGIAGYALNKATASDQTKLDASAAFLAYLMSYDGQQKVASDGGLNLPSIRSDLSIENPEANWHKQYGASFNMEAYLWGSEYKMGLPFLADTKPEFTSGIVNAMNTYVGAYALKETADTAYNLFKGEVQDVFNSIV